MLFRLVKQSDWRNFIEANKKLIQTSKLALKRAKKKKTSLPKKSAPAKALPPKPSFQKDQGKKKWKKDDLSSKSSYENKNASANGEEEEVELVEEETIYEP